MGGVIVPVLVVHEFCTGAALKFDVPRLLPHGFDHGTVACVVSAK